MAQFAAPVPSTEAHQGYADGFRAIAILGIVVVHAAESAHPHLRIHRIDAAQAINYGGTIGVAMLFVLSGFLLAPQFIAALLDDSRPKPNLRRYYLKRFLRIYPLYAAAVLIFEAFYVIWGLSTNGQNPVSFWNVASHLLFLHDFSIYTGLALDNPLWTMPIDVEFYLVLPLCFALLYAATVKLDGKARANVLRIVLLAVVIGSIAFRAIIIHLHPQSVQEFVYQVLWIKTLPGMSATFALGILIALEKQTKFAAERRSPNAGVALVVAGLALALIHAWTRRDAGLVHAHSLKFVLGFAAYDAIAAVAAALILLGFVVGRLTALDGRFWAICAVLSYSIYVFHQPIIVGIAALTHIHSNNVAFLVQLFGASIVLAVLTPLTYRFIERPFLEMKARIPATPTAAAVTGNAVHAGSRS